MSKDIKKLLNELLKDALPESRDRFVSLADEMEELGKIFQSLFENQTGAAKNTLTKAKIPKASDLNG